MHALNWYFGWTSILLGFGSGTFLGIWFYREDFWGGYASFRRRIVRLGHISLVALGALNVLVAGTHGADWSDWEDRSISAAFLVGGATMPAVCFLSGWNPQARRLFFIPVVALLVGAVLMLWRGPR
jgi:hypothetical protein